MGRLHREWKGQKKKYHELEATTITITLPEQQTEEKTN